VKTGSPFIKNIFYLGTDSAFSTLTNKRIFLSNALSLLCVIITLFFIYYYASINQKTMVLIEIAFTILYAMPLPLNYLKWTIVSRSYFNVIILLHIFLLASILGPETDMHVFFIPCIMAPFVLFEFKQKKLIVLFTLFNVLLVSFLFANLYRDFHIQIDLPEEEIILLSKVVFYIAILCCVAIIYSLLYLNERTTRQLDMDKITLDIQLEAIFNNSADALFLVNWGERKIVKANRRAIEMFEAASEKDFLGKFGLDFHKNYPTTEETDRMKKLLTEKGNFEDEILYKTFKGKEFWGALSVKAIDINGEKYQSVRLTDISEQKKAKEQTETALKEKELLLAEIHHRVKNNLAIISALINLQVENLKDEESKIIFEETKDRIYSMALIHNQLYQNKSFAQIEFAQYINNFCSYLTKSYQTNPNIEIIEKTETVLLEIKTAIPCALILNELITNSFKHAFKNQAKGKIEVGLKKENNKILFWVYDTGSGMENKQLQSTSMGMSLITSLVEQIDGNLDYENKSGSHFLITFDT